MPNPGTASEHVLDNPPPFHSKLLDYGERPYWSPDGARIAFIETNYGDACELDFATRTVRNLTRGLGDHHSFLRVLFMHDGSYLLIGPKEVKDRHTSRHVESEMWWMDREASRPPVPLGRRFYEGMGDSWTAPRITYAMNGHHDPALGSPDVYECHVTEIEHTPEGPTLVNDRVVYRADGGRRPELKDFRHGDSEVIFAEYVGRRDANRDTYKCVVKGVDVRTGRVRTYIDEPHVHNECEGIFPDHEHICLESSRDNDNDDFKPRDLWKLKLDGSGRRVRMTHFYDRIPWRATNSNVSPDGRWLAYMVSFHTDESCYGRGLGLLDLAAWDASPAGQQWETAPVQGGGG